MENKTIIEFDPNDFEGMEKLMQEHGNSKFPFEGKNEDGESVMISVFRDRIVTSTMQSNGWTRVNTYYADGTREETFER